MPRRGYGGDFSGKHVVITGGSEGIGLAVASELVTAGAHITLMARGKDKLAAAQSQLRTLASSCHSCSLVAVESVDVTSFEQAGLGWDGGVCTPWHREGA